MNNINAKTALQPGDIIYYSGHFALYIGDNQIAENTQWNIRTWPIQKRSSQPVIAVYRITPETAATVDVSRIDKRYLQGIVTTRIFVRSDNTNKIVNNDESNNNVGNSSNVNESANKPIYQHTLVGTLKDSYSDSSIDVKIEKIDRYYVAKIWVKDPSKQVNKAVADWGVSTKKVSDMLNSTNGAIVGVNGSGFSIEGDGPNYPPYTARGHYIVTNGTVVRKVDGRNTLTSIGISKDGQIMYYENSPYSDLERDGIYNTFSFGPLLIKNGVEYTQTESSGVPVRVDYDNTKRKRTLVGQVDENNYVLIILDKENDSVLNNVKAIGVGLHCRILYNLDGGGSTTLWLRKGTSGKGSKIAGGSRKVMDSLYFSSLE